MKSNAAGSSFGWFCGIARLTGAGGHSALPANDKNFCPELLPGTSAKACRGRGSVL